MTDLEQSKALVSWIPLSNAKFLYIGKVLLKDYIHLFTGKVSIIGVKDIG